MNIVIATTSINRPELHNDIFPDWLKWIGNVKGNIYWFINIDIINELSSTFEETKINYENIVKNLNYKLTIFFFKCDKNIGNFLNACKRLSENIYLFIENLHDCKITKIIWLEDDWKLNINNCIDINELISMYSGNMTTINLTFIRNNYIHALAPSIISYDLWKSLHYLGWKQQTETIDPEHCLGLYYLKHFGKYEMTTNITMINKQVPEDFFTKKFINYKNSYIFYGNNDNDDNINNKNIKNFIDKNKIIEKFNNTIIFIRLCPSFCIDGCNYGRKFMSEHKLIKNKDINIFYNNVNNINVNNICIKIGKSNKSNNTYYLKSILKLSNNFIAYPFGCTKLRYQYDELFDYFLREIKTENNYIYYELNVIKKNINTTNCPHNIKNFINDGWLHDLILLNIQKKYYFKSCDDIKQLIPENYGTIEYLPNNNLFAKYSVGIVSPIFGRSNYLQKFLDSITKSNLINCILVLIDESLTKDVDEDKINANNIIKNYINDNITIIKIYKNKHGNMHDSILIGFDLLASCCNYLTTIDSDTIHKSDWINICIDTFEKIKFDVNHDNILLSGFNTINLNKHTIKELKNNYVIKNSVGGCHLFFHKNIYYEKIRKAFISHKWDSNIINIMNNIENNIIATTKPSVVEHIGYKSSVRIYEENVWDYSMDF